MSIEVANTGSRRGDEVAQLYLSDLYSSVSRPKKELSFLDRHMEYVVELGSFQVMVGGSSAKGLRARFRVKWAGA